MDEVPGVLRRSKDAALAGVAVRVAQNVLPIATAIRRRETQ